MIYGRRAAGFQPAVARRASLALAFALAFALAACSDSGASGTREYEYDWQALLPGPGEEGHDAALERIAYLRDRQFHAFHAFAHGLSVPVSVPDEGDNRQVVTDFLENTDSWDFEAETGRAVTDVVGSWWGVAGMYGGAGAAADAYRYGVLRDQHYPAAEVDRARALLLPILDMLHLAVAITGGESIARGLVHRDFDGGEEERTVPLFDGDGNPLPAEKDNGTWREDNSVGGQFPDWLWNDSCSRDMLIGWLVAWGAAWEVIRDDEAIPRSYKDRLRDDARSLLANLRQLRQYDEEQYDLELEDADGRTTYHGYLHENNVDRAYVPGVYNGFHAIMALGTLAVLEAIAEDPDATSYLYDEIMGTRDFVGVVEDHMMLVDVGLQTNYSNVNMAMDGVWLASRFLRGDAERARLREAVRDEIYARRERDGTLKERQPAELKWTWYDWVFAAMACDSSAEHGCSLEVDAAAFGNGLQTLQELPAPPFFSFEIINCDEQEIESGDCTAVDGTHLDVLGHVGRNGDLITAQPVPMRVRPPSDFYWRSTPYMPNGGNDGPAMYPGVDFRLAYWSARWVRK